MTADEWNGKEYQEQRPKGWCSFVVLGFVSLLVLIRKGLKR